MLASHDDASPSLEVTLGLRDRWVVAAVAGELDLATVPVLRERLNTAIAVVDSDPPLLALDLAEVGFCDSSGLGLLVHLLKRIERRNGHFILLRPHDRIVRLLDLTGLGNTFNVADFLPDEENGPADLPIP